MNYATIYERVKCVTVTCCDCGAAFEADRRTRAMRCPPCRKAIHSQRTAESYRARRREDNVELTGYRRLVLEVIGRAILDATGSWDIHGSPMPEMVRLEARGWLRDTGREWMEMLGHDAGMIEGALRRRRDENR